MRSIEVRHRYAVHPIRILRILTWITDLDQKLDATFTLLRRISRRQMVSLRIDEHLQRLMARRERPFARCLHERVRLIPFVEVDAARAGLADVILDDYGPVAERYL